MASGVSRTVHQSLKGRMYSVAAANVKSNQVREEPKGYIKKLPNGMFVGTVEDQSPLTRIAVVAKAGSRFETEDNIGISHLFRFTPRLKTIPFSGLAVTRWTQQMGSELSVVGTRENIYYKAGLLRKNVHVMADILESIVNKSHYKPWEVADLQTDFMHLDKAILKSQPFSVCMELLHQVAFRNTLGQSLYAPNHMIGKYDPDMMREYHSARFGTDRLALVATGYDIGELEKLALHFSPPNTPSVPQTASVYGGGEVRVNTGGDLAYVAIAFQAPSFEAKESLAAQVLKHVMGMEPSVKYSPGKGNLTQAVQKAVKDDFNLGSFYLSYSDNGLLGFTAVASSKDIDKVVKSAAEKFHSVASSAPSEADIKSAKLRLKVEISSLYESSDNLIEWLGDQVFLGDRVITPSEAYKMVDAVSAADVASVAKRLISSRPSLAATGNTWNVPYLDQIFKK